MDELEQHEERLHDRASAQSTMNDEDILMQQMILQSLEAARERERAQLAAASFNELEEAKQEPQPREPGNDGALNSLVLGEGHPQSVQRHNQQPPAPSQLGEAVMHEDEEEASLTFVGPLTPEQQARL